MTQVISINLPEQLSERLNRLAQAAHRPVEELVVAALSDSVPTPPTQISGEIRDELISLETLSDDELTQFAQSTIAAKDVPEPYQPGDATDRLMLQKAYALVLLKWRGHPIDEITPGD